jgi:single-stranded DNA-binding protein
MFSISCSGYVTGDPVSKETDYGPVCEVTIRCRTTKSKPPHYVTGRVYGKRMQTILDYVHDGDQFTFTGGLKTIMGRKKKNNPEEEYFQFYVDIGEFALPSRSGDEAPKAKKAAPASTPEPQPEEEDEIPF